MTGCSLPGTGRGGRRHSVATGAVLAIGLVAATVVALAPAALANNCASLAIGAPPGFSGRALVVGQAHSRVLSALKKSGQVNFVKAAQGKSRRPGRYDMLVLDGKQLSSRRLAHNKDIARFTTAHRWVLGLHLNARDKARAFAEQAGFQAPQGDGHWSAALFYRRALIGSTPRTLIIDAPKFAPTQTSRLGKRPVAHRKNRQARRLAGVVRADLAAPDAAVASSAPGDDAEIPTGLQHVGWTYCTMNTQMARDGWWTRDREKNGSEGFTPDSSPPPGGPQTMSYTFTNSFDVYLDNSSGHPQGDKQIVTYNYGGQFTPKLPNESFFHMDDQFGIGLNNFNLERSWTTGDWEVALTPDAATNNKLIWQASEPQTPNAENQYSSGQDFSVGFEGSKEGASVNAEYTVHNEHSYSVPDWGVQNKGAGNHLDWMFNARHPCNIDQSHLIDGCFDDRGYTPLKPNDLARSQLQFHSSARWVTNGLLEGNNGQLNFNALTKIETVALACTQWFVVCSDYWTNNQNFDQVNYAPQPSFNASDVIPVPVKSLTLSPNPANGATNQDVTGTVTLEKPAPMDITLTVYSDSRNAVVGGPSGHGSQRDITIAKGTTSTDFKVQTNDNGLKPGDHTSAAITAFYAEPTTQQLRIESPASG